jgi:hypothetical protein
MVYRGELFKLGVSTLKILAWRYSAGENFFAGALIHPKGSHAGTVCTCREELSIL